MVKTYLKIFFITGILFFFGVLFSDMTLMPFRDSLIGAVSSGLLFGLTMSAVLGTIQIKRVRSAARGESAPGMYDTAQYREIESRLDDNALFAAVTSYLKGTCGFRITGSDQGAGRIYAQGPFNIWTFGTSVQVRIEKREGAPALVKIVSAPMLPTLLCDYGENYKVARGLQDHLKGVHF